MITIDNYVKDEDFEYLNQKETIDNLKKENEELKKKYLKLENKCSLLDGSNISRLEMLIYNYKQKLKNAEDNEDAINESTLKSYMERQERIFKNKENHGFNTTNIYQEARYILEEVAELMRAVEKNDRDNMKEELADIVIFAYGCAEVARLGSLDDEIFKKMEINEKREYHKSEDGDFVKDTK
jgi:NTP pyrophosphatase (non-canonical NTP hydrolase)